MNEKNLEWFKHHFPYIYFEKCGNNRVRIINRLEDGSPNNTLGELRYNGLFNKWELFDNNGHSVAMVYIISNDNIVAEFNRWDWFKDKEK